MDSLVFPRASLHARTLLWLLLAMPMAAYGCRSNADRLFADAVRAMDDDDYVAAERYFREITISSPNHPLAPRALYELAQIYHLRLRDVSAAQASLLKVLNDYPESPVSTSARRLLASIYDLDLHSPEKAVPLYREILEGDLDVDAKRATLLALANCRYGSNEIDEAASAYREALSLPYDPSADGAYLRLAILSWIQGAGEESLRLLRELESRTKDPRRRYEALRIEVDLLMELQRFNEANDRLRQFKEAFPQAQDLDEVVARLHSAELEHQSLEENGELEELQKKIHWGSGHHAPREP